MAVLLWHLHQSAKDPDIGYNDADETLQLITRDLVKKPANVKVSRVESALYACNLMNEAAKFWHPFDLSFDDFVRDLLIKGREPLLYNKFYNFIESKNETGQLTLGIKPDTIE